jgi:hypothetical protein
MNETFELLVSEDVKNKLDQHDKDFLRLPENRVQWRDCLLTIIDTVTKKIDSLQEEINRLRETYSGFVTDPAASLDEQKDKAVRFRFYAEKRLAEADRLLALGDDVDPSLSLATFLRDAIIAHRQWHVDKGLVNSEGDDCLYAALDGEWKF